MRVCARVRIAAALLLAATGAGCLPFSYEPRMSLGVSPERLPLRVEVHDLQDVSPPEDRRRRLGGTSATATDSLAGELSTQVTDAILTSFRNDAVFSELRRRVGSPDLVMSGNIREFYAVSFLHPIALPAVFTFFPPFLGVPIYASEAGVDLEITFALPDGQRVATYAAARQSSYWSSIYRMPFYGVGTDLNKLLSEVMLDVRQQMYADREKLLRAERELTPE